MSAIHPSKEQLALYRSRLASAEGLLAVDRHIAECDECFRALAPDDQGPVLLAALENLEIQPEHPSFEAMERFVDDPEDNIERELVEGHIDGCDRCRSELADLLHARDASRAARPPAATRRRPAWRWLPASVAAALAIGFAVVWLLVRSSPESAAMLPAGPGPPAPSTTSTTVVRSPATTALEASLAAHVGEVLAGRAMTRPAMVDGLLGGSDALRATAGGHESGFSLYQPLATLVLDPRPQFRWAAARGAARYTVTVADADTGAIAVHGSTDKTHWRPPTPLRFGRTYSWQVTASGSGPEVTAPRPPLPEVRFRVASSKDVREVASWRAAVGNSHLALGILLAEGGFVDDGERELELDERTGDPRAGVLLGQVRSWRRVPL
jgi:anti-sigma factor RsiW